MADPSQTERPRSRNRMLAIGAGVVLLAGVVTAGVIAAGGNGPARANLPTVSTSASSSAIAPAAPAGKGAPIAISGTDPITGRAVNLASFTGKPVVLQIWASWCPGCNEEAPDLAKVKAAAPELVARAHQRVGTRLDHRETGGVAVLVDADQ